MPGIDVGTCVGDVGAYYGKVGARAVDGGTCEIDVGAHAGDVSAHEVGKVLAADARQRPGGSLGVRRLFKRNTVTFIEK